MFLKLTKSGGRHYAQRVESFRNESGQSRQRTICMLGRLEPGGDVDKLIAALQRARGLDATPGAAPAGSALDGLRFEGSRCAGDVWALWQLWRTLGFDDLAAAWRRFRVEVDVLGCLRAMVFNRLCDPGSKLGVLRWLETVALPLDFGFADGPPQHQHLLRAMDVLDEHSDAPGERLATLMRPLIDEDLSVVFYDLTTVEVAGEAVVADDVRAYERGFRVLKSDIKIGPVYHRLPQRIRAHALMCFMALILYRVRRMRLKANNREESPTRLLQQLQRIHQQTVSTTDGQKLHGLTEMTPAQKSLFTALQLPIPKPAELSQPVL